MTNFWKEKGEGATDSTGIKKIIKEYYKLYYANKFDHLDYIDKFVEWHKLPKLTQDEIENTNSPICILNFLICN